MGSGKTSFLKVKMKNIIIRHNQIFKIEGSCCLERLLWELRILSGGGGTLIGD